jgi:predicted short-subunit dehydrogenase-like oxidoreductase (DUF2520 family)
MVDESGVRHLRMAVAGFGALGASLYAGLKEAGFLNVVVLSSKSHPGMQVKGVKWDAVDWPEADLYWLCVPDDSLETVVDTVREFPSGALWIHCSGALALEPLVSISNKGGHTASVHFMQSFTKASSARDLQGAPASVLTSHDSDTGLLASICNALGARPFKIDAASKPVLHLAAVLVSNFWVLLAEEANRLTTEAAGVPASALFSSLMQQTLRNLQSPAGARPITVLSGPLRRADGNTIRKHLSLPEMREPLKHLYTAFTVLGVQQLKDNGLANQSHFNMLPPSHAQRE